MPTEISVYKHRVIGSAIFFSLVSLLEDALSRNVYSREKVVKQDRDMAIVSSSAETTKICSSLIFRWLNCLQQPFLLVKRIFWKSVLSFPIVLENFALHRSVSVTKICEILNNNNWNKNKGDRYVCKFESNKVKNRRTYNFWYTKNIPKNFIKMEEYKSRTNSRNIFI